MTLESTKREKLLIQNIRELIGEAIDHGEERDLHQLELLLNEEGKKMTQLRLAKPYQLRFRQRLTTKGWSCDEEKITEWCSKTWLQSREYKRLDYHVIETFEWKLDEFLLMIEYYGDNEGMGDYSWGFNTSFASRRCGEEGIEADERVAQVLGLSVAGATEFFSFLWEISTS